jgi:pimeloyl-ACP methyl ester carboxylesterase
MSTYVLIHGAAQGGWCWNKIRRILEDGGHVVYTPDLPGHSPSHGIPAREITFERYVSFVRNMITAIDEKVILAGHSLGGAIITCAMETIYQQVDRLVYVCALIPRNGDTIGKMLEADPGSGLKGAFSLNEREKSAELIADKIDDVVYNGCEKEDILYAKKRIVPQSIVPMSAPITLKKGMFKKTARTGIVCTQDRSLTPAYQETMCKNSGCAIRYLKSGHAPFFSQAGELGEILMAG